MELYVAICQSSPLFMGVGQDALIPLLTCLQASKRTFARDSVIFAAGESASRLGIVLTGRVNTVHEDVFGARSILGSMGPGELFADAFCCTRERTLPVSIVAQSDSTVLLIEIERILHTCAHACEQHRLLTENLVHLLAEKYVSLNRKLLHLSGRTTRRKLLSYLAARAADENGAPFTIPFNRQELADYLFLDRSGLSAEWSRLKREGVLTELPGGRYALVAEAGE